MGEREGKGKVEEEEKKRRVGSLGWLTESSILPKKQKEIEGVGPTSILELKAQLYQSQEDAKRSRHHLSSNGLDVQYHPAKQKTAAPVKRNAGVESRDLKDKLELKAINDGAVSYAALERKAALYEKLVKGEISDEEEQEKYCVDFFRKGIEQEEAPKPQRPDPVTSVGIEVRDGETNGSTIFSTKFVRPGQTPGVMDTDEHKRLVREVHQEASQAREKASELKLRREELAAARREKLKQLYLRKKLEQIRAASDSEQKNSKS